MKSVVQVRVQVRMIREIEKYFDMRGADAVVDECLRRVIELEESQAALSKYFDMEATHDAFKEWLVSHVAGTPLEVSHRDDDLDPAAH